MDGMAAVIVAYKDFADAILSYCKSKVGICPKSLTIIFDSYNSTPITQSTQIKRGQPSRRVYITSMIQKMLTRDDWDKFLNNPISKPRKEKLEYPLVVAHENLDNCQQRSK